MARKKKVVPDVLWRLFGKRARTLGDTILALIPPRNGRCLCKGRLPGCISCFRSEALHRSDDSPDYRNLLNRCYVVVSENAPPLTVFDPHCRWDQHEIVTRSIQIILREQSSSSNVICCSYDKVRRSSAMVDVLTSSNWSVLLKRVGDALMVYLLRYTSLFLPLTRRQYHQIAGFPISDSCLKSSSQIPEPRSFLHPLAYNGSRKRKLTEEVDSIPRKRKCTSSLGSDPNSNSSTSVEGTGSSIVSKEDLSHKEREGSSKKNALASRKRKRKYCWMRKRRRRQFVVEGAPTLIPCGGNHSNNDNGNHSNNDNSCQKYQCKLARCFCCSIFQNEPKMNRNAEIDRRSIFYKLENSTLMFPMKHTLHTLKPNASGAAILFNNIFETSVIDKNAGAAACSHRENGSTNSTCLYHSLIKLLKRIIRSSQNGQFQRLLEKHCPISTSHEDSSVSPRSELQGSKCCPEKNIVSFLWAICRRIVPSPLLGEPSNWRILRRNISKFIYLRRFEKFSLKECTYKLKINKFGFFSNKLGVSNIARHAIFECWIFWLFAHFVSPLVQANFYVTETEYWKQKVIYYRKSVWEKLMGEAECLRDNRYSLLNHACARKIIWRRQFGFSKARLRPKQNGLRMLTNLGAPSRMHVDPSFSEIHSNQKLGRRAFCNKKNTYRYFKAVNTVLQDLHAILKGLTAKEPEKLGSSVFDYNDVYRKLVPFRFLLKNGSSSVPNIFMVVSDVSKAYDSVNHDKLISVMNDVIVDAEFPLEKLAQVICKKKSFKVHYHQTLAHQDIVTASARISSRFRAHSFESFVVKKGLSKRIRKAEIISMLKEHIKRNVVKLGNNFYMQSLGIPQGSILSTILCSIYYGDMDRNAIFPFLEKVNKGLFGIQDSPGTLVSGGNQQKGCEYLLLRLIDDYLLISTSEKQASMFFSRVERGVRDYNCNMNREKYGVNFNMSNGQECPSNRVHVGKDGISFLPWSGLLVNCSTLEIQADYTRYHNCHLSSSLTVSTQGKVGSHLKTKLRGYLRPKCHPLFYDSNINSPGVVRLNIYQAFLLCAMKFISHISHLSVLSKFTPIFCFNAITGSLRYMSRLIRRKMRSFKMEPAFRPKYDVKNKEVILLGLYAFARVVRKKQTQYRELVRFLHSKLETYGDVEDMSNEFKYAVDDVHSSVLWSIKY